MTIKRLMTFTTATAATVLALWLSFRNVKWAEIGNVFVRANYAWVAGAVASSLLDVYVLGFRWRPLLAPRAKVSMPLLFRLNIVAQYANILMPARINEVLRAWMISREACIPGGFALGTIAIERIFDVAIFMALWVASPALFSGQTTSFSPTVAYVSGGLAIVVLVLFVLRPDVFLKGARIAFKVLPAGLREKAGRFMESGIEAFAGFKNPKAVVGLTALSLVIFVFRVLTLVLVARAVRLELTVGAALFVLLVRQLGEIPPAAPGKIGIFEYTVIVALSAFGVARTPALSYAVMLHLVTHVPKIFLGGAFVGIRGLPRADHESAGLHLSI